MIRNFITICLSSTILISCGPSKEDIEKREKFVVDSIAQVEKLKKEEEERERIHQEKINVGKEIRRTSINELLQDLNEEIVKEKARLTKVEEFQFGRALSEKERQINEQTTLILALENTQKELKLELAKIELFKPHSFQDTPQAILEHLFDAAKKSDYSNLRDLIDPYGEFDENVLMISLLESMPTEKQEDFNRSYSKGRVVNDLNLVESNHAVAEVAYGSKSDRLQKVHLIKRQDLWFLQKID